jgi:hypothetical protein
MLSIYKKTVCQLAKEFWLPFLIAVGWTIYNGWGQEYTAKSVIASFGPSFFLASWMTGQIFRVRKQAGMEARIESLQDRLRQMVDDFHDKALWTINHITGGDSYCYAEPQLSRPSYAGIRWDVKNSGAFPMYQVTAKIDDLDSRSCLQTGFVHMKSEETILGDIPCEATRFIDWNHFGNEEDRHFTITFDSRNGRVIQDVRLKWIDGKYDLAFRLRKDGDMPTVLKEIVPNHFPRDESGHFDWREPRVKPFATWVSPTHP